MRVTIKWRFVLKFAAVCAIFLVAVSLVHSRQVRNQVGAFLHQADLAKEAAAAAAAAGDTKKAGAEREREETYLRRYLLARPDDVDTRERLGRLLTQTARNYKQHLDAYLALEEVLRRDPSRDELRRFTLDTAVKLGMVKEAQEHIRVLLAKKPDGDGELEGLLARCLATDKKFEGRPDKLGDEGAVEMFARSIAHRPDLVESYLGLAFLQRAELKKEKEADEAVAAMLKANPDKFRALLGAAGYLRNFNAKLAVGADKSDKNVLAGRDKDGDGWVTAEELVLAARGVAPDELDVLLAAAEVARSQARSSRFKGEKEKAEKEFAEARQLLARAVERHDKQPAAYLELASLDAELRQPADALAVIQKGLAAAPEATELTVAKLEYQFRAGDAKGAADTLDELKTAGLPKDVYEFHNARVRILNDAWTEAAQALERLLPELQDKPVLFRQANLLLGRCYEQRGEHQKRLAAFEAALTRPTPLAATDPLWGLAKLGVAEAQVALGQADKALETYGEMRKANYPGVLVPIARLEMLRALRVPEDKKPDWEPTEEALAAAEKAVKEKVIPDTTEVRLLRATLTHYQGKPAVARKQLEALAAERPKEVAIRLELALQDVREKNFPKALATLEAAEKEFGDSPDLRLTRANLWARTGEADLAAKLAGLAAGAEKFGLAGQRQLLRGLAEIASRAGTDEAAGKLWDELARVKKHDLGAHLVRFDRASRAGDTKAMGEILSQIEDIDGENGPSARLARVALLVKRSQDSKDPGPRNEALALLNALEREGVGPPLSGRVALGQAVIHDANGNADAAIEKYSRAVDLGEASPEVLRRLVELLYQQNRGKDAEELFRKLPPAVADSADLQKLGAALSLGAGKNEDAIRRALKAVPEDSASHKDQLYLGRMYWVTGDRVKAEARFRKATELKPDAVEVWLDLIECLVATDRKDEATKTFERAREKVAKADRAIFAALGYARLGESQKAVEAYEQARKDNPNDATIAFGEAEYLFRRGQLKDAREAFNRVLKMPSAAADIKASAQRQLALATAADPDAETSRQALELSGATLPANATPAQRRGRAVVLALQKDRASKQEAIQLLEDNPEGRTPGEQFLLAQLHNQVGDKHDRVRVLLADLLRAEKNQTPLYVGYFSMWLLRNGDLREAEKWVGVLEKLDKDSLQTAELKARLAMAKKDTAGARAAIVPKADAPNAPVGLIARVCEDIGLVDDAERLLKRFVEENQAKRPEVVLVVAAFYGRHGRTADGLRVWDEAKAKLPAELAPTVGGVGVEILYNTATPKPDDVAAVAKWLTEAAGKAQGATKAALKQQLASVRNLQADYAGAAALYREAIADNPRDALAMNNLAYLRSANDKRHDEALGLIDQAKRVIGTNPELLDTEALIRLEKNEVEAAIKLLEVVVAETPKSGSAYFHLARAYDAKNDSDAARRAWRKAVDELKLSVADLHPLERPGYEAMKRKFPL